MIVGILALQGAFAEHGYMLDQLGAQHESRTVEPGEELSPMAVNPEAMK